MNGSDRNSHPDVFRVEGVNEKLVISVSTPTSMSVAQSLVWRSIRAACVAADLLPASILIEEDEYGNLVGTVSANYRSWSNDPATEERLCQMIDVAKAAMVSFGFQLRSDTE